MGPCTGDASKVDLEADADEKPLAIFERLKKALEDPAAHLGQGNSPAVLHARRNRFNKGSNSSMVRAGGLACGEIEDSVAAPNNALVIGDVDSCRDRCDVISDCRSFSYSANFKMCYLKRACGTPKLCKGKEDWQTYYYPCPASRIRHNSASRAHISVNASRTPANITQIWDP